MHSKDLCVHARPWQSLLVKYQHQIWLEEHSEERTHLTAAEEFKHIPLMELPKIVHPRWVD